MALQDFSKKERLERLVWDLEKIGHVSSSLTAYMSRAPAE
jgi:hypothetical protein